MTNEWLLIDTHVPGRSCLGWLSLDVRGSFRAYKGRPVVVLRRVFLHERSRLLACQGLCVVAGPGSFSAIRIGVLYANMLARLLGCSLVGISVEEAQDRKKLAQRLLAKALSPVPYVAPIYDREPNITSPRAV